MSPHILVTGGSGLLGHAVKHVMSQKDPSLSVVYLSSSDCDVRDINQTRAIISFLKPTHVIHLAARVGGLFDNMSNNAKFLESNVKINMNVLTECAHSDHVAKVVSCLSTCIFPSDAPLPLTVESLHNGLPHSSNIGYSYSKRLIDIQNRVLHNPDKTKFFTGVIPTNLFGPHDNFNRDTGHVIPALIHKVYVSKKYSTPIYVKGSGKAMRQFLYSRDAAELIVHVVNEYDEVEPLILAPPEEYSISQVVKKICEIFNYDGDIVFEKKENDDSQDGQQKKTADGSKIERILEERGISFKYTNFDTALKETIEWFIENYETCRK